MNRRIIAAAVFLFAAITVRAQEPAPTVAGPTLASIQARGELACGVNTDLFGFGYLDPNSGDISGFDVDFCRVLALATLGDVEAVRLVLHTVESGQEALVTGEIDILLHNVSGSLNRDILPQLDFGPANFYSGQTIMVVGDSGLETWETLAGKTICVANAGAAALAEALAARGVEYEALTFDTVNDAQDAFVAGRCDAHAADQIQLAALRYESDTPFAYSIWEETYTIDPLVPMYRYGDEQWADIVEWTLYGLVRAEELDITSENIDEFALSEEAEVVLLLTSGTSLALPPNYMVEVIRQVGNYSEIYERHLGANTPLRLPRGLNALWSDDGLMYAPPFGN